MDEIADKSQPSILRMLPRALLVSAALVPAILVAVEYINGRIREAKLEADRAERHGTLNVDVSSAGPLTDEDIESLKAQRRKTMGE